MTVLLCPFEFFRPTGKDGDTMDYTYTIRHELPDTDCQELEKYELEIFDTTDPAEQLKDILPAIITRYMEEAKVGTNQLSRLTGIAKGTITRYCHGTAQYKEDYLCAICIALRLKPAKQRHLFQSIRLQLRDGIAEHTARSYIVREYLDGCYYDSSLTVISCNDRLIANKANPITKLSSEMEGKQ